MFVSWDLPSMEKGSDKNIDRWFIDTDEKGFSLSGFKMGSS